MTLTKLEQKVLEEIDANGPYGRQFGMGTRLSKAARKLAVKGILEWREKPYPGWYRVSNVTMADK